MKLMIGFLLCTVSYSWIFANTTILECDFSNPKYEGSVSLDALGEGVLRFRPKSSPNYMSCPLSVQDLNDMSGAISPSIDLAFFRQVCQPFDTDYADIFIRDMFLSIDLSSNRPTQARFHWLKEYHPEECTIQTISLFDLKLNAKKFKKGLWGRYPSSKKHQRRLKTKKRSQK